jgi:hypothetical protein
MEYDSRVGDLLTSVIVDTIPALGLEAGGAVRPVPAVPAAAAPDASQVRPAPAYMTHTSARKQGVFSTWRCGAVDPDPGLEINCQIILKIVRCGIYFGAKYGLAYLNILNITRVRVSRPPWTSWVINVINAIMDTT